MISSSTAVRFSYKHMVLIGLLSVLLLLSAYRYSNTFDSGGHLNTVAQAKNEGYKELEILPPLKVDSNDVPVVIVDEHNEVIPYWYKGIDEGLMNAIGNTLVHIDGHSDMATPDDYNFLKKFTYHPNAKQSAYLPLMQANDVFIASAIMQGLINNVIWVQPSWNDDSQQTLFYDAYIGLASDKNTNSIYICDCLKMVRKGQNAKFPWQCARVNRNAEKVEDMEVTMPQTECKKMKSFKYIIISEEKFMKLVDLKKVRNLFIDIDEDFFGVESGVQALLDSGVTLENIAFLDETFPALFCPKSAVEEVELNKQVKIFFKFVSSVHANARENKIQLLKTKLLELSKVSQCDYQADTSEGIGSILQSIMSLTKSESDAFSKANYCLFNSPRFQTHETRFSICHGTIYPGDDLNKIFVSSEEEIRKRGKRLAEIIAYIYKQTSPRMFTIARSLRDGYTPRKQQQLIEREILKNLGEVVTNNGKKINLIYDKYLVFGKDGWKS